MAAADERAAVDERLRGRAVGERRRVLVERAGDVHRRAEAEDVGAEDRRVVHADLERDVDDARRRRARLDRRDARVVDAVRAAQPQRAHLDREPALLQRVDHAEHQHEHERGHHEHRAAAAEPAAREAEPAALPERLGRRVAEGDCGCRPSRRRRLEVGVELHFFCAVSVRKIETDLSNPPGGATSVR